MKTEMILLDDVDLTDRVIDALERCNTGDCCSGCLLWAVSDCNRLMLDAATIIRRLKSNLLSTQLKLAVAQRDIKRTDPETLTDFVDDFCNYLLESKNNCNQFDDERSNIEACVYEEVFQIFGRKVESRFGIDVFDKENKE